MAKPGGPTPIDRAGDEPRKRSSRPGVRIESDGTVVGSRIYVEDTDTEIKYVQAVDVRFEAGRLPTATLHVLKVAGRVNAEVEAIKEKLVPAPRSVLVVKVGEPELLDAQYRDGVTTHGQRITITRLTNRGVDHTETVVVCEGWVSACEPFELTVPEVE